MSNVPQWVGDIETYFHSVEDTAKQFLETHVPGLAEFARKVQSSPLMAAAEAIAGQVDPAAEQVLARALTDLASLAPVPAAPPPPAEEPPAEEPPAG